MFLLNLNWIGGLGTSVSKTRALPGVYSLIVPVLSAPEAAAVLEVCAWANPMRRAAAQTTPRIDLTIVSSVSLSRHGTHSAVWLSTLRWRRCDGPKDRHRAGNRERPGCPSCPRRQTNLKSLISL